MATASASLPAQVDEPDLGRGIGRDMRAASHSREKEARAVAQIDRLAARRLPLATKGGGRALARERIIAEVEIARLLRATVSDLERRAKRGKR